MSNQMKEIDWSKAPEEATHYSPKREESCFYRAVFWRVEAGRGVEAWSINDDGSLQHYDRPTWIESDMDRLIPRPFAWTGEGLPPVGTVCEFLSGGHWFEVEVKYSSEWLTVIKCLKNKPGSVIEQKDVELALEDFDLEKRLRPIRTPEQIAAEERESHINGMLCHDALGGTRRGLAEALYDAGYRRVEQ